MIKIQGTKFGVGGLDLKKREENKMKVKQECAGCGKVKRKNAKRFVKIKTLRKKFFITNPGLNDNDRMCSTCADILTKPFKVGK